MITHEGRVIVRFSTELKVTIGPDYRPTPVEDPGELGPNEFTAGSVLSLNCDVQRNSSSVTYSWSVTGSPDTPGCQVVINVGLYPSGFNGELCTVCVCVCVCFCMCTL